MAGDPTIERTGQAGRTGTTRARGRHDREILRLAVPAFGALVAEPLYLLADTAIVGHLGSRPLAGLAVAGTVLTAAFSVFNFLAYSTTASVARAFGADDRRGAARLGVDGCWLAVVLGLALTVLGLLLAAPITRLMGASPAAEPYAVDYLRISILGAPAMLVMLAGTGYLRGLQDTRTPLVIAVAANTVNLLLELLLVYGADLGIAGSAWGTVAAQYGAALAYLVIVGRQVRREGAPVRPDAAGIRTNARVGSRLVLRTASLIAAIVTATAIAARISDDAVGAQQICMQVLLFLAFALDALAIAGQAMIGRFLGADSPADAKSVGRRLLELGVGTGVVFAVAVIVARPWLVGIFSNDAGVRHLALQALVVVALVQPVAAVVFVLDGVLIGAGDAGYLALAMVVATFGVYLPAALAVALTGAGLLWLWGALTLWMLARFVGMAARYRTDRWAVTGLLPPG